MNGVINTDNTTLSKDDEESLKETMKVYEQMRAYENMLSSLKRPVKETLESILNRIQNKV